ncbi:MAG: DUF1580 domain-containing protein [Pirellulales bacterium]
MHRILGESRLTLAQLARSQGVNTATAWRWALKGVRGVKLESLTVGGRRVTSAEAFDRFVTATNPEATATQRVKSPHQRQKEIREAVAELREARL